MIKFLDNKYGEKDFLNLFFDFFNQKKINYIILRNYKSLPNTVEGTDIDIFIDKSFSLKLKNQF